MNNKNLDAGRGCKQVDDDVVHVRLPEEIHAVRLGKIAVPVPIVPAAKLEETDFHQDRALRRFIHDREGGRCFYCLRRIERQQRCLDHVVPRAKLGRNFVPKPGFLLL